MIDMAKTHVTTTQLMDINCYYLCQSILVNTPKLISNLSYLFYFFIYFYLCV